MPASNSARAVWRTRLTWLIFVLVVALTAACTPGCTRDEPAAEPRRTALRNTIEATNVGARLIVTATVTTILTPRSFVVADVDLPAQGLLVLSDARAELQPRGLVTVYGVLDRFDYARLAARFDLAAPAAYHAYDNRKILVAADVSSRA
ncbi:hypothetical protein CLV70_1255 [Pseudosporangium ferrugineum]|uniref:Uncharacterized protein n=1 Tax=Pseudosporangium ferrugineum TaxID=439699 RepID=A0A2T0RFY8_9ACTN|nr:hypothetical protein CLV70_1255 [Pseudosporangium ferrugineum]